MDIKLKLLLILGIVVLSSVALILYIIWYNRPKWAKVYDYLRNVMWQHLMDQDISEFELMYIVDSLIREFNLTEEQSKLCINNWRDQQWFEQQSFLKDET